MPKNTKGGKKHKRSKNTQPQTAKNPAEIAKEGTQLYGKVVKALGAKRFTIECQRKNSEGEPVSCQLNCGIKGSTRDKIIKDSYVLIDPWEFTTQESTKGTIIRAYKDYEIASLQKAGLWDFIESENTQKEQDEQGFVFGSESSSDDDDDGGNVNGSGDGDGGNGGNGNGNDDEDIDIDAI